MRDSRLVLSIGKLGQGQERYYLEAVAEGAEDYYLFAGEAPGSWSGGGSGSLGLGGTVSGEDFTSVLTSRHPRTGEALGRAHAVGKVPGFDLTFSAPKSVSLLFALGDELLSQRARNAHDAAVQDALGYLERTASHGRRGRGGLMRIESSGFVAAVFRHRTSRAGDPNLHSHVVVANRVLGADGHWSALDARALYVQARTAGTLYQSSLRYQLRDLGLSWTVARSGLAEIDGVPLPVRRAFSQRRQQIEEHLALRGVSSPRAAQVAALNTRAVKDRGVDPDGLRYEWRERAAALGFTDQAIRQLLLEGRERVARTGPDRHALLGPSGLTAQASSFSERDVLRAVANAHPDGLPVAAIQEFTREVLDSPEVVALGLGATVPVPRQRRSRRRVPLGVSERRYSTRELLALEQRLVEDATAGAQDGVAVPESLADEVLALRPELNAEQTDMVRHLTTSGAALDVVEAAAGAGKTTALGAVSAAFAMAGLPVVGTTLSAKAAGVLRDQTGMPTFTNARLLADLRDARTGGLAPHTVLVVDEASQVGTRTLVELHAAVRQAKGKLVLVGDPHQLPEIDAGGAFRGLLSRLRPVRLVANHRQRDEAERARLRELRRGSVELAMTSYDEAGRVTRAETAERLREQLVHDWAAAYTAATGQDVQRLRSEIVMLGLTNSDVEDLNRRAQDLLARQGLLGEQERVLGDRAFRQGDHVVTRQNDRRLGVLNGQRWLVAELGAQSLVLVPIARLGAAVELPVTYAESGWLQHAYALTTAVSQGSSVEQAFVLGSDATYREAGYTAASRARERTQFYVVSAPELGEERHGMLRLDAGEKDALVPFVEALSRSAAQSMGLDTQNGLEPVYAEGPLAASSRAVERVQLSRALAGAPKDERTVLARLQVDLAQANAELVQRSAVAAAPGRRRLWRRLSSSENHVPTPAAAAWEQRVGALKASLREAEQRQQMRLAWEAANQDQLLRLQEVNAALALESARSRAEEGGLDPADTVSA